MFVIINLILISLLPILAICINYPYGYICWILVLSFAALFNIKAFHVHTERYPLNNYSEYEFNPFADKLTEIDKSFIIEIEKKLNIYEVKLKEKTLIFDMKGCIFPLTIINLLPTSGIRHSVRRPMPNSLKSISTVMKKISSRLISVLFR